MRITLRCGHCVYVVAAQGVPAEVYCTEHGAYQLVIKADPLATA
jgi:hypothetical protein